MSAAIEAAPPGHRLRAAGAVAGGALLLAWPALLNGYPLVFSDTGAFLAQTIEHWPVWDKPFAYGPALHTFHWRVSLWGPLVAQVLVLAWLVGLLTRVSGQPGWALPLCAGLAGLTAAPWFAALLMPDWLAPALVLALALLGFGGAAVSRGERLGLGALAALACATHLSHLPVAAALVLLVALLQRRWRPVLHCAAPLLLALAWLAASNAVLHGRAAVSPYGAVFALARLVADGPAARTIAARCPAAGWHMCRWAGRLPTDADDFLWTGSGPVWAPRIDGATPGGPISLAPEAGVILRETLVREPFAVLRAAAGHTLRQLAMVRVGDALVADNLAASVGRQLALGFPVAEQARFAAGLQAQGRLPDAAAPYLVPQPTVLLAGLAMLVWGGARAWRRGAAWPAGLAAAVLLGLLVNAAVTGALSGPHHRYQARIAWLLPLAGALVLRPAPKPAAPLPARLVA